MPQSVTLSKQRSTIRQCEHNSYAPLSNEAVPKIIFKVSDDELTFSKAVNITQDTENAAKAAKEQCYGSGQDPLLKVMGSGNKKCNEPKKDYTAKKVSKGESCYHYERNKHQAD